MFEICALNLVKDKKKKKDLDLYSYSSFTTFLV